MNGLPKTTMIVAEITALLTAEEQLTDKGQAAGMAITHQLYTGSHEFFGMGSVSGNAQNTAVRALRKSF